jgi:hypothetical protein
MRSRQHPKIALDAGEREHRRIADSELLLARRDAAALLEPADASLDDVPALVQLWVEGVVADSVLVAPCRDDGSPTDSGNSLPYPVGAVPLVTGERRRLDEMQQGRRIIRIEKRF